MPVLAREMDQRVALMAARGNYFADQDIVIAGGDKLVGSALQFSQRARQQRNTVFAAMPFQAVEPVLILAREALGNLALIGVQNTEPKELSLTEQAD